MIAHRIESVTEWSGPFGKTLSHRIRVGRSERLFRQVLRTRGGGINNRFEIWRSNGRLVALGGFFSRCAQRNGVSNLNRCIALPIGSGTQKTNTPAAFLITQIHLLRSRAFAQAAVNLAAIIERLGITDVAGRVAATGDALSGRTIGNAFLPVVQPYIGPARGLKGKIEHIAAERAHCRVLPETAAPMAAARIYSRLC